MLPKTLRLIRHGESQRNLAGYHAWHGNTNLFEEVITRPSSLAPLTDEGVRQAIETGKWLKKEKITFDRLYVSSMNRAKQTAGLLDIPGAQWFIENRIRERSAGVLEDMLPEDREKYHDSIVSAGHMWDPYNFRPDRGESFGDLEVRLRGFFDTLHRSHADTVGVVSHGHVMKILEAIIYHMTPEEFTATHGGGVERILNGMMIEYTRIDPATNAELLYLGWMRFCTPWKDPHWSPWKEITRKTYSSTELLQQIADCRERSGM